MASIQERSLHYERVRSLTILLVVIGHIFMMYHEQSAIPQPVPSLSLSNQAQFIYAFHMPLFIAISGMVYGLCVDDLDKYHNYFKFLWNKVKRLLVPYVIFGCLYVAPVVVYLQLTNRNLVDFWTYDIFRADNPRHLWYLVVLFMIFAVIGIFRPLTKRLPPILFLIPLAVLSYYALTDFPFPRPMGFQFRNLCRYGLWFYVGYAFNRHYHWYMRVLRYKLAGIVCLIILIWTFWRPGIPFYYVSALAGMGMMLSLSAQWSEKSVERPFFKLMKRDGMGIYLFHPMIIYVGFFYLQDMMIQPPLFALLMLLVSLVLSVLATELLRLLHLGVLLGEAQKKKKSNT